jgi:hypothetical protein
MNGIRIKGDKILVENLKKDHLVDGDIYWRIETNHKTDARV